MLRLAFDKTLSFGIKPRVKIAIFAAPAICMMISLVFSHLFAMFLAGEFGIPDGVPVIDQENGGIWTWIAILSMFVFLLVGYVIGWLVNILGSLLILRWPYSKVVAIFSRSEIPQEWCKAPVYSSRIDRF